MNRKKLVLCLLVFLSLWALEGDAGEESRFITGERVQLSRQPLWTISGAWSGERLLLVDVLKESVLEYDTRGRLINAIADRAFERPVLIHAAAEPGLLWLEDEDGRLLQVNNQFQKQQEIDLLKVVTSSQGSLISVSGWAPLGNSALLVFGDFRRGKEATGAILSVPLAEPAKFKILQEIPIESAAHRFFLLGQPFVAGVGGKPFYAMMGGSPTVFTSEGRGFQLVKKTQQGKQLITAPELPGRVTMSNTALLFQRLEQSAYPAGVYGTKDALFVLMRNQAAQGSIWSLLKVNPETFELVWNRRIATTASHLLVVPGEKYWAFVEKGPVKGPGNQTVRSFLRVPAEIFAH